MNLNHCYTLYLLSTVHYRFKYLKLFKISVLFRHLTSAENRHALPMFTSLLNTVCAYDPVGLGVPYNHLLFNDSLEPLVEAALQILIVTLDHDTSSSTPAESEDVKIPLCYFDIIFLIRSFIGNNSRQFVHKLSVANPPR